MSPPIKGEWRWDNDYILTFTPSEYWLADQNYVVNVNLDGLRVPERVVFPKGARKVTLNIRSRPLSVNITDMAYMQDPDDPQRKLVAARFDMNYPALPETLEERLRLTLEEESGGKLSSSEKSLPYDIQFGADQMSANLSVPIKKLPGKDRYLQLEISPGVKPEFGGQLSSKAFKERARVPSLTSYLAFQESSAVIARSENGAPEQVLSFETNVKAKPAALVEKTRVYLLPFEHPVMGRSKEGQSDEPYRWQAANEVTPAILEKAEQLSLQAMPNGAGDTTRFGFGFKAPQGRYLYVTVGQGLEAFGGYTLEKKYENIIQVPAIPNDIEIMQDGSILTLSGAKKLSLHARGTDKLKVEVAQILPEALQHFISQTQGDIRNPSFKHWTFDKKDITRMDEKDVKMAYIDPYASQYAAFDFAPYLKDGRKGIFLLNIEGLKDGKSVGVAAQRFVLVTDMGLLVKQNADASRDVFLTSFQTGYPVAKADVSVLGQNGLQVFTGQTDKDGHITLPDFAGYEADRQPVAIVAQKGDDYAFIPYDRRDRVLNTSRFDVGGTRIAADGLNAFLFSDRGIYRPGETVHVGMIVKNADWQPLPPALPLKVVITDPRGRVALENSVNFSAPGLEEVMLETGEAWPTGVYIVNLYISNDGKQGSLLGSTSVRVEEFMPDRLKIKTEFIQNGKSVSEDTGWLKPDDLKASVDLKNLYGTPASERQVKAGVTLNPARLSFKQYPDYHFYDPYAAKARSIHYDLPGVKTDQNGYAELPLKLERQEKATYSLNLETTGYEAGSGKGVSAYSTALVSPMDYVIGYHAEANLGYLSKGKDYQIHLQALNPELSPVDVNDLSLDLVKKTYISTLIKRNDGSYVYESVPKEETIKTQGFSISQDGIALVLPSNDLGDYIYRLKTAEGLIVADIPFSIAGEGQRKSGQDREAVLKLKTNKSDYEAGETIELNITAPYTGAGLITLESDHILAYKWFRTDKMETLESIEIPKNFSGKGYVNVAFVRDINSREIYLSPLSNAIVPFTAGTESRSISIDLNVPETAKPGEAFEIKYKGNQKGKAIIFAVDEGILQVAKYKTPSPVDYFLLNRALQVQTSQMLDLLMPDYELIKALSADGGGAALEEAVLGKHLNPFRRKILAPAVYWSGIVDLDREEKTLSFTPPGHFNGELRVMAVAVGAGHVGAAEKDMSVRSDIVITPNMPIFLAPGDKAEASVTIANGLKGSGPEAFLSVRLEPSAGLNIIKAPAENVSIAEGTEYSVAFTVEATDTLGPASLIVHASIGDVRQSAEATLSIRPPVAKETTMQAGYAKNGKADVTLTRHLYPEFAEKNLSVSPLPSAYIYGLLRYLDGFPYGCTEQITSRIYPQLSLMSFPEFSFSEDEMKKNVGEVVSTLRRRQTQDGGFSLWNGGYEADDFVSIYAMDFLLDAYTADLPVPSDMMQRGFNYLRNWANQDIKSMDDARNKAYAIYILTRSGMVTSNEILHWLQYFEEKKTENWKTDLSAAYIAASYEMMQQKKLAAQTMDGFEKGVFSREVSYKNINWNNPYYSSFVKYAQYVSILSRHFPERFAALDRDIVFKLADFISTQRYNTLSASYAIQALGDYAAGQQAALSGLKVVFETEQGKNPALKTDKEISKRTIPQSTNRIVIESGESSFLGLGGGGDAFFYTVSETGYSRDLSHGLVSEGMEIERTYQTSDGKALDSPVNIGDIVEATITIRAHGDDRVENVALVDLLPAGFALEPENGSDEGSTLFPEFVERREDRLIIFTDIAPREQVFRYSLRAVSRGEFQVPPPYAEAMYDLSKKAKGRAGTIVVRDEAP
ncbi:MAG: alpha-2-macroglobulin [Alphaproteobacteria bacterium]